MALCSRLWNGSKTLRQVLLVPARQVLRAFCTAHEVARQQRVESLPGPSDLLPVEKVDRMLHDLARAEPCQRLKLLEFLGPVVVQLGIGC